MKLSDISRNYAETGGFAVTLDEFEAFFADMPSEGVVEREMAGCDPELDWRGRALRTGDWVQPDLLSELVIGVEGRDGDSWRTGGHACAAD